MSYNLLKRAYQLTQAQEPFVLATVVWCERPTSAKPGAQAIIQSNGHLTGWIGGSCTQPVIVREALRLLREGGDPYLLHLGGTNATPLLQDVRSFPMSCASGGAIEVYIEPHFPQPQLVLIGDSPVITALSQMAPILDFNVTQIQSADLSQVQINERTYVLIATHGQYDEDVLKQVLPGPAIYVGMVASKRRAEACREYLRDQGIAESALARLKAPAGLDIGAVTPEEIAASILPELVHVRHHHVADKQTQKQAIPLLEETPAIDPVCGMEVEIVTARHRLNYNGQEYFFCCPACKKEFEHHPQDYLAQQEAGMCESSKGG